MERKTETFIGNNRKLGDERVTIGVLCCDQQNKEQTTVIRLVSPMWLFPHL
jgi:hypothetical protein